MSNASQLHEGCAAAIIRYPQGITMVWVGKHDDQDPKAKWLMV